MEVTELKNTGLIREFKVSFPAKDIVEKAESRISEEQKSFKLAGFREGNVPINIVKKQVGPQILSKVIEQEVDVTIRKIFEERNIVPALQPNVEINTFEEKGNITFTLHVEVMPNVPSVDWSQLEVEVIKIQVTEDDLKKAYDDIIKNFKNFNEAPAGYAAKKGDAVIIDFLGKVNDKEFDGGKGEGIRLELGSGQFVPGFEDQLIGAKSGIQLKVRVIFPKNYNNKDLAGKPAVFDVKIIKVLTPESVSNIDDEFAKKLGVESLEQLNELIKQKLEADLNGIARLRLKKLLFDKIDAQYKFDIPPGMLKIDFETMWNEIKAQKTNSPEMFKNKSEEEIKNEYMEIARRRVRLGILLAEIAKTNNIEISDADLQQAVFAEALMRPGQEKIVLDFYAKKENLERLRGPILEEKAVDHILSHIKKNEIAVTSKEFFEKYANDLNAANQ